MQVRRAPGEVYHVDLRKPWCVGHIGKRKLGRKWEGIKKDSMGLAKRAMDKRTIMAQQYQQKTLRNH